MPADVDSLEVLVPPSRRTRTRTGSRTWIDCEKLMTSVGMVFELEDRPCRLAALRSRLGSTVYSQNACLSFRIASQCHRGVATVIVIIAVVETSVRSGWEWHSRSRIKRRTHTQVERAGNSGTLHWAGSANNTIAGGSRVSRPRCRQDPAN